MPFGESFVADASHAETANIMSNAPNTPGTLAATGRKEMSRKDEKREAAWMAKRSARRVQIGICSGGRGRT